MSKKTPSDEVRANDAHLVAFLRGARGDVDTEFQGQPLKGTAEPWSSKVTLSAPALPDALAALSRLERLSLLTEEVIFSLLGKAPIDEFGILRALQSKLPHWTFEPTRCTVIFILAKEKDVPIALMQLDLLTDDILFIARQKGKLVTVGAVEAHVTVGVMRKPGITAEQVWAWFQEHIAQTIRTGQEK